MARPKSPLQQSAAIRFIGKTGPTKVRREQVRAFLHATLMLLAYHNRMAPGPVTVRFLRDLRHDGKPADGLCCGLHIDLDLDLDHEAMLTACIHEMIHACIDMPDGSLEKCTSTLTARLKPDVARLAEVLVHKTYQRAAYLAHTKIRYVTDGPDYYDRAQHAPIGVTPYKARSRKRNPANGAT